MVDRFSSSMVFASSAVGLLLLGGTFAFLVDQRNRLKEA
jgi:hypothetical protein